MPRIKYWVQHDFRLHPGPYLCSNLREFTGMELKAMPKKELLEATKQKYQVIKENIDRGLKSFGHCALCLVYDNNCIGCPVKEYTHFPNCTATRYGQLVNALLDGNCKAAHSEVDKILSLIDILIQEEEKHETGIMESS